MREPRLARRQPTSLPGMDHSITVMLLVAICLLVFILLTGCAVNLNMVDVQQEATPGGKDEATAAAGGGTANGSNTIIVSFERSPISTNKDQKSTGEIPIGYNGGTAGAGSGGLTDVASKFAPDLSKKDSENQTTNNTQQEQSKAKEVVKSDGDGEENTAEQVDTGKEEASEDIDYKNKASFASYGVRNGGRQAWRIAGNGPSFGQPIKFVFSSGKTFTVRDTSKNCRDDESTCSRSSSASMYGFVFKPGLGPNGDGDANTGTSHGGIYLHAPYGDSSKSVTLYYNKP